MRATFLASALLLAAPPAPAGTPLDLGVDVPTSLGAATYAPNQIVREDRGSYSVLAELPPGFAILALEALPAGGWLLTPAFPAVLGGVTYTPRDVVRLDGAGVATLHLDGQATAIPDYARIDALALGPAGDLLLSFDVPVEIRGVEYGRSDLVQWAGGGFALAWSGPVAGIPESTNLVGTATDDFGATVMTFDVPTDLDGSEYLPGDLVRIGSHGSTLHWRDPDWPRDSQMRDFSLAPSPVGAVPDGGTGMPLTAELHPTGEVTLRWGEACGAATTDYEVYEGRLGDFASHRPRTCGTGGGTTWTFAPPAWDAYYLVVPRSAVREGSYGSALPGGERPASLAACLPQTLASCP